MIFHDITLVAGKEVSRRRHDSTLLAPAAVAVFARMFDKYGDAFRWPIPVAGLGHLSLEWTAFGDDAMATFWSGRTPLTTSALLTGTGDEVTDAVQRLVVSLYKGTVVEPAWDLRDVPDRPLLASLVLPSKT